MQQGEENNIINVRRQEKRIEQAVLECIQRVDKAINGINLGENDLNMAIVENYTNPTKDEINQQLNTLPATMAYYNNMKVYSQLLLEMAEHELFVAEVNAREKCRREFEDKQRRYEVDISNRMAEAMGCAAPDKAMMAIRELIKALKPKDPTKEDYDAYIKRNTEEQQRGVVIHRYRFNKLKEISMALNNKYLAVRALRYSVDEMNKADTATSYQH